MAYPESWKCPSCGSIVYNNKKCDVCGYIPPSESGGLNVQITEPTPAEQAATQEQPKKVNSIFKDRIIAFLIDMTIITVMGAMLGLGIAFTFSQGSSKGLDVLFPLFGIPTTLVFIVAHPIYFAILEGLYAQTYGKQIRKIKVQHYAGMNISRSITRNITRFIEMIPLYIPSILMIKKDGKRLGDKLAKTTVIRVN